MPIISFLSSNPIDWYAESYVFYEYSSKCQKNLKFFTPDLSVSQFNRFCVSGFKAEAMAAKKGLVPV